MFGALRSITITIGHALSIHRVDTAEERENRKKNGCDLVLLETKRRLWWHIASSDWLLTYMSGSQAGTYVLS